MPTRQRLFELFRFAASATAFWTVIFLWSYNRRGLIPMMIQGTYPWIDFVAPVVVVALIWATLTPLIVAIVQRAPVAGPNRWRNLALLVVAVPAIAATEAVLQMMVLAGATPRSGSFWPAVVTLTPSSVTMTAFAVLAAHVVSARAQAVEREQRRVELETQLTRTQSEALRARLSPAFLFGTLDEIAATIRRDPAAAERLLTTLSELLRGAMDLDGAETITLADELHLLDRYLELQPQPMSLVLEVDERARQTSVSSFVLQTFVSAMIPDAVDAVTIRARTGDHLYLTVSMPVRGNVEEAAVRIAPQIERLFGSRYQARIHHQGRFLIGEMRL